MKIVHEGVVKDYEVLFEIVRKHVEKKARKKMSQLPKLVVVAQAWLAKAMVKDVLPHPKPRLSLKPKPQAFAINGQKKGHALEAIVIPG